MPPYRIVTFDGGGVRGVLTTTLLERLEARVPGWLDKADLIAGTSAGGLIALGLAVGLSPARISRFYVEQSPTIFQDSLWDDIVNLGRLIGADYDTEPKRRVLHDILGDKLLKDLSKRVLIPAFDLDNEDPDPAQRSAKAKFFHNFPPTGLGGRDSDDRNRLAVDVGLYTSAAPSYFPSVGGYIDGGIVVNNPSMAALAQTQDSRAQITPRPALSDIVLLSLGTGDTQTYVRGQNLDWGLAQWAGPLLNVLLNDQGRIADYQCLQLLGTNYYRLNPLLPSGQKVNLDDHTKIPQLIAVANGVDLDRKDRSDMSIVEWLHSRWA